MAAVLPRNRASLGILAALACGIALAIGATLLIGLRAEKQAAGPIPDDRVVATLQTGTRSYPEDLQALLRATRAAPDDPVAAERAARRLIDYGRSAGDSRLVGAALSVLRPWLETDAPDAGTLLLAATARQYQHDFIGALGLLDEAVAAAPHDGVALLTRATIHVVLGRLGAAQEDCRRLFAERRLDLGFICQATANTITAAAPTMYSRLAGVIRQGGTFDAELRIYAIGLMGEIAALQGQPEIARTHLAEVLADDPGALRTRMMLADVDLSTGDAAAAFDLLRGAAEIDGVLLRRAIAADRLGDTVAARPAKAELARRFRQNLDLGLTAHAREETRFFLEVEPDPALALRRAIVNWRLQREIEDAQLLIDAATAADEPRAAAPVLRWIADQGIAVPTLRIPDAVRAAAQ